VMDKEGYLLVGIVVGFVAGAAFAYLWQLRRGSLTTFRRDEKTGAILEIVEKPL